VAARQAEPYGPYGFRREIKVCLREARECHLEIEQSLLVCEDKNAQGASHIQISADCLGATLPVVDEDAPSAHREREADCQALAAIKESACAGLNRNGHGPAATENS